MKRLIKLIMIFTVSLNIACEESQQKNNYVLVHGAYHGKWCWYKVIPILEKDGNKVYAIDLPGHGQDNTPPEDVTLEKYKEKILQTINKIDGQVILIGHSLGGISISSVAETVPDKIESLIYLSAVLPIDGESAFVASSLDPNPNETVFYEISDNKKTVKVIPDLAKDIFYNTCSDKDKEYGISKLSAQAMEPFFATVNLSKERFGNKVLPIQYPLNPGNGFNTIVDALRMTMYVFPEGGGKPEKKPRTCRCRPAPTPTAIPPPSEGPARRTTLGAVAIRG